MHTEYQETERIWKAPELPLKHIGLGQAILQKLRQDDPNRVLEVHYDKDVQLRVRDILEQTIAAARMLMENGIQKGDVVVLYSMVNEWITPLTFACYIIGAPVNFFETRLKADEIKHILGILQPATIIYEDKYENRLFSALECMKHPQLRLKLNMETDLELRGDVDLDTFQVPDIGDPTQLAATLMLTSATTGPPKIVQHSHAMMMQSLYIFWTPSPAKILCLSVQRWISQVVLMMQPVFFGAQRIYTSTLPGGVHGKDIVDKFKVTHYFSIPGMYMDMLRTAAESKDPTSLSSLKIAMIGGEVVSESLVEYSKQVAPQCRVVKCYGMTELAGCAASDEKIDKRGVNGGALRPNFMAKILDDHGQPVGPNQMGRLFLKTPVPFLGYLRNDELNRETFVEDGWINTGDFVYMDSDRLLNVITRYKNLVRSRNTVVIPNNVEDIVNKHPEVMDSVLIGHPDEGNEPGEVGTVFAVRQGTSSEVKLQSELRELLNRALHRSELEVVKYVQVINEMPLTNCAKVNRNVLKSMAKGNDLR